MKRLFSFILSLVLCTVALASATNRKVVKATSTTVEQVTHYYPYGGVIGDISTQEDRQKYKFEGKELDRSFGLDHYDIHARNYFAMLPMWDRVDPLAEKYYGISPYVYCGGDPVNQVDQNGENSWKVIGKALYKVGKTVAKKGVSSLKQGATYAEAFSDLIDDVQTLTSSESSVGEKTLAVASLASEIFGLVSVKDVKTGYQLIQNSITLNSERKKAVREAWKQEKELVGKSGTGTRDWTRQEKEELLKTGKVKGYEGHHIDDVHSNPESTGDPNNIEFMKRKQHLQEGHGGKWTNPSTPRTKINLQELIENLEN